MIGDLTGRRVLIQMPESGLGRALADTFAARGAQYFRTEAADFAGVLTAATEGGKRIDTLIHEGIPCVAPGDFSDWRSADLLGAITNSTWPFFEALQRIKAQQQCYPRYAIALSSAAPAQLHNGADLNAASDSALETLCRYVGYRLLNEDVRINVIRHRLAIGELEADLTPPHLKASCTDVANAAVALCSGWIDAMQGQVLSVDCGGAFANNLTRLYEEDPLRELPQ